MEVLFAVLILTMGLVFVAANFPVGIMNAGKVAESTRTIIDTHNAQIMTELQLGGITEPDYFKNASPSYIIKDGEIRLLSMPNVRRDEYVVMDDPGELYFDDRAEDPNPEYHIYDPGPPEGIDENDGEVPYFITTIINDANLDKKNIGMMVSPMVDISDREVQNQLPPGYDPTILDNAIYDVAMERNYSWCSLYRHVADTNNTYSLYIFTLRRHNKNARYAIQEKVVFDDGEPIPGLQGNDRLFPVPWRIKLDPANPAPEGDDWFILEDHTIDQPFANNLADILQNGSIIVDAQSGHIYKVTEVALVEDGPSTKWMVRLDGVLMYDLLTFWVFPPPIVRAAPADYFEGKQPVVKVTQKNLRF